ncbi:EAL domain-containing protein [Pontibacillus sp. HMF3514]|uniref:EAL domain-containing protein n=1 Tax=Pontibacillus sp. HMF3514 TaxID=2692425 RepID=UPI00131FC914|nr:EAL domain-containing protein [Pontibacillus sp. HMF3514]QHE53308.1 EAL domain-containing protein [Pontibacillus sp. HMF3514]
MATDCQACGTSVNMPEKGYVIVRPTQDIENWIDSIYLDLIQKEDMIYIYHYQSFQSLLPTLENLLEKDLHDHWLHLTDEDRSYSFPITIQHLYERITNPELVEIIYQGNFTSFLQPIIHMQNGEVYGYEALLRTKDQKVSPGELFPFAQRAGLHSMLDQKAREEAVKAKAKHIPKGQKCFINFLPSTIYVPEYCLSHTFHIVSKYNVNPEDLVFEVVETEEITNVKHLHDIFKTYQNYGMNVALDDVGSGYSTIEMFQLLHPHIVKIDRSYIQDCHLSDEKQSFLIEVIDRAKQLNIKLLAEGIETKDEFDWLHEAGIDYGQGYYIGKPDHIPCKEPVLL